MKWAYANCVFTEQNVTTVLNAAAPNPASHQSKVHRGVYVYWAYAEQEKSWLYVHSCYVAVNDDERCGVPIGHTAAVCIA